MNLAEMPRRPAPGRCGCVFAEVGTPSTRLLFDCFVHDEVYEDKDPRLVLHDTAYDGVVDLNDPAADVDRLDPLESIQQLGRGAGAALDAPIPRHADVLRHVFASPGWDETKNRADRCAVDDPMHAAQVSMVF